MAMNLLKSEFFKKNDNQVTLSPSPSRSMSMSSYHEKVVHFLYQKIQKRTNMDHGETVYGDAGNSIRNCNWNFTFDFKTNKALVQLGKKSRLTVHEVYIVQWEVFIQFQFQFPNIMNPNILCNMFQDIIETFETKLRQTSSAASVALNNYLQVKELYSKFWKTTEELICKLVGQLKFQADCILIIENSSSSSNDLKIVKNFIKVLSCIYHHLIVQKSQMLADTVESYGVKESMINCCENIIDRFSQVASQWFKMEQDKFFVKKESLISFELMINFISSLTHQLNLRQTYLSNIFKALEINLLDVIFSAWKQQLVQFLQPTLLSNYDHVLSLLQLQATNSNSNHNNLSIVPAKIDDTEKINNEYLPCHKAEDLFKLYLALMKLFRLRGSCLMDKTLHVWFLPNVVEWIQSMYIKNIMRIQNAINVDNFQPLNRFNSSSTANGDVSSSAVDVSEIIMKHYVFWNELSWPILEESYCLLILLLKNLFQHVLQYLENISFKIINSVQQQQKNGPWEFIMSEEQYLAINNIAQVVQHAQLTLGKFQISNLITNLTVQDGKQVELKSYAIELPNFVESIQMVINKKILRAIKCIWGYKDKKKFMIHLLNNTIIKSIENLENESQNIISEFDKMLTQLKLNLFPNIFYKTIQVAWNVLLQVYFKYLRCCRKSRKPLNIYKQLQIILFGLEAIFCKFANEYANSNHNYDAEFFALQSRNLGLKLLKLRELLRLNGSSSIDLQIEYLMILFCEQTALMAAPKGDQCNGVGVININVKYLWKTNILQLEVLDANLNEGISCGFIKLQILCRNHSKSNANNNPTIFCTPKVKANNNHKKNLRFKTLFKIDINKEVWKNGGILQFTLQCRLEFINAKMSYQSILPIDKIHDDFQQQHHQLPLLNSSLPSSTSTQSKRKLTILQILRERNHKRPN